MKNAEVFLSYAWGGESEAIVNELDSAFRNKGIELIRDKRDLGFKGMITGFMQRIGEGNAVVAVVSDKYLKSPYCMFELLEIYRNLDFQKRIFPIVMEDANIFDPIPRLQYLKYWQDKKKELDDAITQFGVDAITVIGEDYKIYKKIFDNYGEVINILKDINSLTPNMHRANSFDTLIEAVEKCINTKNMTEQSIPKVSQLGIPVAGNTNTTTSNTDISKKERIDTSLEGIHDSRKKYLLQRLDRLYKLLDEYENKIMMSADPKEKMMSENEIEKLNAQIQQVENDINKL